MLTENAATALDLLKRLEEALAQRERLQEKRSELMVEQRRAGRGTYKSQEFYSLNRQLSMLGDLVAGIQAAIQAMSTDTAR